MPSAEKIFEVLKNTIEEVVPEIDIKQVVIQDRLKDLGANSIDRVEIITLTLEDIGIKIPMMEFAKTKNIEDIVSIISSHAIQN